MPPQFILYKKIIIVFLNINRSQFSQNDVENMLLSMGFAPNYIYKAFKVYNDRNKNTADCNIDSIIEIIEELQNNDKPWICKQCTFQNLAKNKMCSVCCYDPSKEDKNANDHLLVSMDGNDPNSLLEKIWRDYNEQQIKIKDPSNDNNRNERIQSVISPFYRIVSFGKSKIIHYKKKNKNKKVNRFKSKSMQIVSANNHNKTESTHYGFSDDDNFNNFQMRRHRGYAISNKPNSPKTEAFVHKKSQNNISLPHHLSMDDLSNLKVGDMVDYRFENGRFILMKIVEKNSSYNNHVIKLHPFVRPINDQKYDKICNVFQEYEKLAAAKSVSLRKIKDAKHIFSGLKVNDQIDINPLYRDGHEGWKKGTILKFDPNSSQIKVSYHHGTDSKNYSYWFHLENVDEIAPFQTKCNHDITIHCSLLF